MTVHGLPAYVAQPAEGVAPKGIAVILSDVFGWSCVNNRVLAHYYAANGDFLVYLPDFMNGCSVPPSLIPSIEHVLEHAPTWIDFFTKPIRGIYVLARVLPSILRANIWVAWPGHVMTLARDDPTTRVVRHEPQSGASTDPQPLVDCLFTAHPSMLNIPGDAEYVRLPTSVVVGDIDTMLKLDSARVMKSILDSKDGHEMVILPSAKHGFVIRTPPDGEHAKECAQEPRDQAVAWFNKAFS
ncbi:Dienelactone hydrolase family [Geosmithia morbida]|uniref:Dienelactone hydrolase family n=1 Tax=Geosmithia morbida TaxID=1094350 RepID=A0A9P4YW39_9HYPO|nr:Dienelactone hydrolase family [Geosmithia morbida]KAF4122859.1 Dienelactone hydrolase family [Geosmithia morbida]